MKRKLFYLTLLIVPLVLGGCGSAESVPASTSDTAGTASTEASVESKTDEPASEETIEEDLKTGIAGASIEEQVIYEQEGIKITAKSLESSSSFTGPELKFLIENNSSENVTVQARNVSVNGFMVDYNMSADVMSQKKSNDSLTFSSSSFEECGIEQIAEIELSFHIFNSDTWDDFANSDMTLINTSCADTYTQKYDDSGDILYEDSDIRIISKGMSEDSSFMGPSLMLYIENNSDKGLTVQARDTSVNGFMIEPTLSPELTAGKKAISSMTFFNSDIEENQIEKIDSIETSFHIFYTDDWETLVDTETINIAL